MGRKGMGEDFMCNMGTLKNSKTGGENGGIDSWRPGGGGAYNAIEP